MVIHGEYELVPSDRQGFAVVIEEGIVRVIVLQKHGDAVPFHRIDKGAVPVGTCGCVIVLEGDSSKPAAG
jgi:hypothetical protein